MKEFWKKRVTKTAPIYTLEDVEVDGKLTLNGELRAPGTIKDGLSVTGDLDVTEAVEPDVVRSVRYQWKEDFDEEAAAVTLAAGLRGDEWTGGGTNSADANVTYTAGPGGTLQLVTAGTDDDSQFEIHLPNCRVNSNPILEARFKVTDITNVFAAVGFVEGSFVDKASPDDDIALICIDSDDGHTFGAAHLCLLTNDNNAGAVYDDLTVPLVANTFIKVRLDLTDTEQPRVWINGTEVDATDIIGTVQAGTTLMPYIMVQSLSGAADTMTVDYICYDQDRA